jgi:PAS domain S-box-containing protein
MSSIFNDNESSISQTKRIEEARKDLIQSLFQDSPMALFCFQMDGPNQMTFPLVNDEFIKLMPNVMGEDGNVKSQDIFKTIHPDNLLQFLNKVNEAYANVATFSSIIKTIDKDGHDRYLKILAIPFKKEGDTVFWNGSVEDNTEITLLEQSLVKSKTDLGESILNYKSILDNSNDIIQSIDARGNIIFVNNQWLNKMGYTLEEVLGQNIFPHIHPDSQQHCIALFDEISKGQEYTSTEIEFISKDGKKLYTNALIVANFKEGVFTGTQGFFKNITSETETGELLSNALININEGYFLLNSEYIVQEWNKACEILTRVEKSTAIGKNIFDLFSMNGQNAKESALFDLITGKENGTIELYSERLEKWVNIRKTAINKGISVFLNDISENKRSIALLEFEKTVYLKFANDPNATIEELLFEVINGIEKIHPKMLVSILRLEGTKLYNWSTNNLPIEYNKLIEGFEIGDANCSCGTAAYLKQNVIVSEIESSHLWKGYVDVALSFNLKACWSFPLLRDKETVIGTFAIYHNQVKEMTAAESDSIDRMRNLAYNLIELKASQKRQINADILRSKIIESSLTSIIISNANDEIILFNPFAQKMFGWQESEVLGKNIFELLFTKEQRTEQADKIVAYMGTKHQATSDKTVELLGVNKNGSTIDFEAFIVSNKDKKEIVYIYFINDLSALKKQFNTIQAQNQQLREIAWMQSHAVRAPLVRIMGLVHLLESDTPDFEIDEIVKFISEAAVELDHTIHEISNKTYELKNSKADEITSFLHIKHGINNRSFDKLKVLLVDDDSLMTYINQLALKDSGLTKSLYTFANGQLAFDYIKEKMQPNERLLIFLDIFMPEMDGWHFLDAIQHLPYTDQIDVIMLSASASPFEKDKARTYPNVAMYIEKELTKEKIEAVKKVINFDSFFI